MVLAHPQLSLMSSVPLLLLQSFFICLTFRSTEASVPSKAFLRLHPSDDMSESPAPAAGPSNHGSRTDHDLLRQFVMEYLQQHGFDKTLAMYQAEINDNSDPRPEDRDGEQGEDEPMANRRGSAQVGGREAIFRAPGPVAIESILKRNPPQAQGVSPSTMSERVTAEFEASAMHIIDRLQKKAESMGEGDVTDVGGGESLLDPSDRVEGYRRYRRWVDGGLDLWKVRGGDWVLGLTGVAGTRCDIVSSVRPYVPRPDAIWVCEVRWEASSCSDSIADPTWQPEGSSQRTKPITKASILRRSPLSTPSSTRSISTSTLTASDYCASYQSQMIVSDFIHRSGPYTIPMSRNPHDLLLQWLSGIGLDDEWEAGIHNSAGRSKEAVKAIIFNRLKITGSSLLPTLQSHTP